jgi:hypothetical protein
MSALSSLFISHGSRDHAIAMEVGRRLRAEGYTDLFSRLRPRPGHPRRTQRGTRDLHPAAQADGVIFLASPTSISSTWCSAEIVIARLLSKPIFPAIRN